MQIGFDSKHVSASIYDEDKFRLKKDEIGRICCLGAADDGVVCVHCHNVQIGPKDAQGRSSDKRSGYYACFGDYVKIFGDGDKPGAGADPDNCPFCKVGFKGLAVGNCVRQFAMDIIRYVTTTDGKFREMGMVNVQGPTGQLVSVPNFICDTIIWKYGNDKYKRLVDLRENYGDLRKLDLMVKCEKEVYQDFTIDPKPVDQTLWMTRGPEIAKQTVDMFKQNRHNPNDLEILLAKRADKATADQLIAAAMGTSATISGAPLAPVATPAEIQNLLDNKPVAPVTATDLGFAPAAAAPKAPPPVVTSQPPAATPPPAAPVVPQAVQQSAATQPVVQQPPKAATAANFDELLNMA